MTKAFYWHKHTYIGGIGGQRINVLPINHAPPYPNRNILELAGHRDFLSLPFSSLPSKSVHSVVFTPIQSLVLKEQEIEVDTVEDYHHGGLQECKKCTARRLEDSRSTAIQFASNQAHYTRIKFQAIRSNE